MRKILILAFVLCAAIAVAQGRKAISILGDSYSTFEGYLQPDTNLIWYFNGANAKTEMTDVKSVKETWWHRLISSNPDYRLCVNNSYSGATISYWGYRNQDFSDRSFITRATNLGCPDVILIFGSTNDSWAGAPVGDYKYEGWTRDDLFAYRPALACLLEKLQLHYPNVELYFILNSELRDEITESTLAVCKHYSVPVIKLHGIDKSSGHPSVKGMAAIAEQVGAALK